MVELFASQGEAQNNNSKLTRQYDITHGERY
jgi:hypothetical protein